MVYRFGNPLDMDDDCFDSIIQDISFSDNHGQDEHATGNTSQQKLSSDFMTMQHEPIDYSLKRSVLNRMIVDGILIEELNMPSNVLSNSSAGNHIEVNEFDV